MTLWREIQIFRLTAPCPADNDPLPRFEGLEAAADIAFIPPYFLDEFLMTTCRAPLSPLRLRDSPPQDALLQAGQTLRRHGFPPHTPLQ